jgi:hypothetical protein
MHFVFLAPDKDYVRIMLNDLNGHDHVTILTPGQFSQTGPVKRKLITRLLARFHDSPPSFLNRFWFHDVIKNKEFGTDIVYVLFRTTRFSHNRSFLQWLRSTGQNVHLVMLYLDVIVEQKYRRIEKAFDLCYTFDEDDAARYQIPHIPGLYSSLDLKPQPLLYDLFFVGESKDRYPLLNEIYQKLNRNQARCKFHVFETTQRTKDAQDLQTTTEFIPYQSVLDLMLQSNAILDLVQPNQRGMTLRFFEALALNKKLVTNNRQIAGNKYYDPESMQIIQSSDDLDLDFIRDQRPIDYHYAGDYSPLNLMNQISADLAARFAP